MADSAKNIRLGLSFGAEDLYLVQVEDAAKKYKVTAAADVTAKIPFSIDLLSEDSGAEMIGTELKNALEEFNISAVDAAVSFDLNLGTLIKIPYDRKLSDKELKTHLEWELEQYVDEDIDSYVFDSFKMIQAPSMKQPELVMVGTRKRVVDFFRETCSVAGLNLYTLTMDVIAAVNAFEANYKFNPKEKIALVEIGEQKVVFTLLEGNFFIGHHHLMLDDSVKSDFVGSLNQIISMNLKTLFTDYELSKSKNSFDKVFFYRTTSRFSAAEFAESAGESEFHVFNPFEKIGIDSAVRESLDSGDDASEFTEAIGVTIQ